MSIFHRFHNNLTLKSRISDIPMSQYPRPQLKRDSYLSLNGKWDDGALIPYPLESVYNNMPGRSHRYIRSFTLPEGFMKDRLILHFGAVDQIATVYVDGHPAATHHMGHLPFEIDITGLLSESSVHELIVETEDRLSHTYPYGKQKKHPGGMWYTEVSGIWQSVWLESVPAEYIEAVEITPSLNSVNVEVYSNSDIPLYEVSVSHKGTEVFKGSFDLPSFSINIENPMLWTPECPNLYDITISSGNDTVCSYFGLRTISVERVNNIPRILLNGEPFFFHGVLDQGYFPEGIYTPNCEKDYEDDILRLKALGFNTIRKHIKIEPECFYEACDRLGMIVFQDMVNNGRYSFLRDTVMPTFVSAKRDDTRGRISEETVSFFMSSVEQTLAHLYNHPCVVYYTIFNEGWGQFNSDDLVQFVKAMDQSRIIDATSGWFEQTLSEVHSIHTYFKTFEMPEGLNDKPVILSEFGGISMKVKGHSYARLNNYGYGKVKNENELTDRIVKLYKDEIIPAIPKGLCGSIYTQITDVEEETNGLYTYDRKVRKVIPEKMVSISQDLVIPK